MADVKTKLLNAFDVLKKEGKKISPFAVEKRAGVANGSLKNHSAIREMVLTEKERYHSKPKQKKKAKSGTGQTQVDKKKYEDLKDRNKRLKEENDQFKREMKVMATSVAQLTWELHRHKTATKVSNVMPLTK